MGLFDEVAGDLVKKFSGGGNQTNLFEVVTGLLNNPEIGGLSGLMQMFNNKGLGEVIGSWVSTGQNLPITPDQLRQALGSDHIQQIAANIGLSQEEASGGLADLLPEVIDKLTPDGKVPESDLLAQGLSLLKGKLFGA